MRRQYYIGGKEGVSFAQLVPALKECRMKQQKYLTPKELAEQYSEIKALRIKIASEEELLVSKSVVKSNVDVSGARATNNGVSKD